MSETNIFNANLVDKIIKGPAEDDQRAKADKGKLRLTLVPTQIIWDIAEVREYAHKKYGDGADEWAKVNARRYVEAMYRHFLKFIEDPLGNDEESGLPHLWHIECNAAFLSELYKDALLPVVDEK